MSTQTTLPTRRLTVLQSLILVRMVVPARNPPGPKRIKDDLQRWFEHRYSGAEWTERFDEALAELARNDLVQAKPLRITEQGTRAALQFLGLESLPTRLRWDTLKKQYLPKLALGLDRRARLAGADDLRAALLKQKHDLPLGDAPTMTQAIESLAWRQLDAESTRVAFNKNAVLEYLLSQLLGMRKPGSLAQLRKQLAARAIDARNGNADELYDATIRRLVDGRSEAESERPAPPRATASQDAVERPADTPRTPREPTDRVATLSAVALPLERFAGLVVEAARQTDSASRFGENKVFISQLWRRVQQAPEMNGVSLEQFKQRLAEANQRGLLQLSQADLVEAMSPTEVAESETRYLNSRFHFLRI